MICQLIQNHKTIISCIIDIDIDIQCHHVNLGVWVMDPKRDGACIIRKEFDTTVRISIKKKRIATGNDIYFLF